MNLTHGDQQRVVSPAPAVDAPAGAATRAATAGILQNACKRVSLEMERCGSRVSLTAGQRREFTAGVLEETSVPIGRF